ncbi:hypothetical protein [Pseudoduganella flava]|uniref:Uncharacterized protein n=1 Tax=Pseudoduganella flava TaxID=871742 RepID=A0ABX6FZU4_9BURK|nr:hypothetical protein [Pseudoduganella flava]QGZ42651.1 hypothetical protein GO485_28865 [Pseudoduganella flava]
MSLIELERRNTSGALFAEDDDEDEDEEEDAAAWACDTARGRPDRAGWISCACGAPLAARARFCAAMRSARVIGRAVDDALLDDALLDEALLDEALVDHWPLAGGIDDAVVSDKEAGWLPDAEEDEEAAAYACATFGGRVVPARCDACACGARFAAATWFIAATRSARLIRGALDDDAVAGTVDEELAAACGGGNGDRWRAGACWLTGNVLGGIWTSAVLSGMGPLAPRLRARSAAHK